MKTFEEYTAEAVTKIDKFTKGDTSIIIPVQTMEDRLVTLQKEWFATYNSMIRACASDKEVSSVINKYRVILKMFDTLTDEFDHFAHDLINVVDPD